MPTRQERIAQLRQVYPEADDLTIQRFLQAESGGAAEFDPIATGFRVAPAVIGGIAGTALGGPAGGVAGSALGSGLGEWLGELREQYTQGTDIKPLQIATQTAIGAIPFAGPAKNLTRARAVLGSAGKGAALGGVASTATQLAEDGELPDIRQLALSMGLGGLLGGGVETALGKKFYGSEVPLARTPEGDKLRADRLAAEAGDSLMDRTKRAPSALYEKLVDRFLPAKRFETAARQMGEAPAAPGESAGEQINHLIGAARGRTEIAKQRLSDVQHRAHQAGLLPDLEQYLDFRAGKFGGETLEQRMERLFREAREEGVDAMTAAGDPLMDVPVEPNAAKLTDRLKSGSQKKYEEAEALKRRLEGGKALPAGMTPDIIEERLAFIRETLGEDRFQQMEELANEVFDVDREGFTQLLRAGKVPQAVYDDLTSREGHIPLMRILDDNAQNYIKSKDALNVPVGKAFRKLSGQSDRSTVDPFSAVLLRRFAAEEESARILAGSNFIKLRELHPEVAALIPEVHGGVVPRGMEAIAGWENGQKKEYAFPAHVGKALKLLNEESSEILGKTWLDFFGRGAMRLATAANLGFAATNPIRDVADKLLLSKEIRNPMDVAQYVGLWASTLMDNIKNPMNANRVKYLEGGFAYSTPQSSINPGRRMLGIGTEGPLDRLFGFVEGISNVSEETSKIASMRLLEKKGVKGAELVQRVRDYGGSPDFLTKGSMAKQMNASVLFFNAQAQGIMRNVKAIPQIAKDPARLSTLLAGATGLEFFRNEWNAGFTDPDGTPSVDRITDNDRENYWTFITPQIEVVNGVERHKVLKLSKGHAARLLFNPISDAIEMAQGKGSLTATGLEVLNQFLPGAIKLKEGQIGESIVTGAGASLNPILRAPVEMAGNRQLFSNIPIVPQRLQGRSPEMQYTEDTPAIYKELGKVLGPRLPLGMGAPRMLQQLEATLVPGSFGEWAREVGNLAVGEEPSGEMLLAPVKRRFKGSPGDQSIRNVEQTFYDTLTKGRQKFQDYGAILQEDPQRAALFFRENQDLLMKRLQLEDIQRGLAELRDLPDAQAAPIHKQLLERAMQILGRTR